MNLAWLWVAALYAVFVALLRRGGNPLPRRTAVAFYLLVLVFFFRPLTQRVVNLATDFPQLMAPWSAAAPAGFSKYAVSNIEVQDVVMQLVPWAHQVREAWRAGRVPLWNALNGCGYPLISNAQGGALSPLRLLALPLPLGYSMAAEGAMKVLLALTFTFLYCRRRGCSDAASALAAIAFGFGPFLIAWLHFAQATVAAFLPAVFHAIDLLAERRTVARIAAAAALAPAVLFSGHPETAAHIVVFAALYVLWLFAFEVRDRRTFAGSLALGSVAGVLLSLPFLVPFVEQLRGSFRYGIVTSEWSRAVPFSDAPSLALLVHPRLYATRPLALPWGPATAESITGFAGILGIAAFATIAIDVVRRRRFRSVELWFVLAATFAFLVIANVPPAVRAIDLVLSLTANARLRFIFAFCLAVLSAFAFDRAREQRLAFLGGLAFAAACIVYVFARANFPNDAARHAALLAIVPSGIVLVLAPLSFRAAKTARNPLPVAPAARVGRRFLAALGMTQAPLLLAAVTIEIFSVTHAWNPLRPVETLYPRTPLIDALLRLRANDPQPHRVVGIDAILFPDTNAVFGIEDVRVLDAMAPAAYMRMLQAAMPSFDVHQYYAKWHDADTPLLDRLNVRWVLTEPARELTDSSRYVLRYSGADGRIYENLHVLPRFFGDGVRVDVLRNRGGEYDLDVIAAHPTVVRTSVGWSRWWRADGLRVRRDGAFVSLDVPAGRTRVRLHYAPRSFDLACIAALLTVAALSFVIIRASAQRRLALRGRALRDRGGSGAPRQPGSP